MNCFTCQEKLFAPCVEKDVSTILKMFLLVQDMERGFHITKASSLMDQIIGKIFVVCALVRSTNVHNATLNKINQIKFFFVLTPPPPPREPLRTPIGPRILGPHEDPES